MNPDQLKIILEAVLLAAGEPLTVDRLQSLFDEHERPSQDSIREALAQLADDCVGRALEVREVASGFTLQVRQGFAPWVARLWAERPVRYSRALLETLALVAYRQPITRAEIEDIRGVTVSSNIIKTLQEREWVRVVGHRDVPGRPALFATTRQFLDHFNLKCLDELPSLAELRESDHPEMQLELPIPTEVLSLSTDVDSNKTLDASDSNDAIDDREPENTESLNDNVFTGEINVQIETIAEVEAIEETIDFLEMAALAELEVATQEATAIEEKHNANLAEIETLEAEA